MQSITGDLFRAWRALAADQASREDIADLLGLARRSVTGTRATGPKASTAVDITGRTLSAITESPKSTEQRRDIIIKEFGRHQGASETEVLGAEGMQPVTGSLPALPPKDPLLNPSWQRGVFTTLLSVWVETRTVNTERLVDLISRREQIAHVPWRAARSVLPGVRCFFDNGPAMLPFLEDQAQLIAGLRLVFGADRVTIGFFEMLPDSAGTQFLEDTDGAASPNAPVLIVSDFGTVAVPGRSWALPQDWVDYIRRSRQAGAAGVFALTPVSPMRVPKLIRDEIVVIEWDRTASVRTVLRQGARLAST